MIDIIGYWIGVTLLTLPIPIAIFVFATVIFHSYYEQELRNNGVTHQEALRRANKLPIIRHIEDFAEEWMLYALGTLVIAQIFFLVIAVSEGVYPSAINNVIWGISIVSTKMSTFLGYVSMAALVISIVPIAGKLCARFSLIKDKIEKL